MDYDTDQSPLYRNNVSFISPNMTMTNYIVHKRKMVEYFDNKDDEHTNNKKKKTNNNSLHKVSSKIYKSYIENNSSPANSNNSVSDLEINAAKPPDKEISSSNIKITTQKNENSIIKVKSALSNKLLVNKVFKIYPNRLQSKSEKNVKKISSVQSKIHKVNDSDMDTDNSPKFHYDIFSSSSFKDLSGVLQISYKYECFQFNSNDLVNNVTSQDFNTEAEVLSKNYLSCFKQAKKYFNNIQSIPVTSNSKVSLPFELEYDPTLDDLPNYNEFTELELSLLQKNSCGCKLLTWDEYQKMHLIVYKSETDKYKSSDNIENYSNCDRLSSYTDFKRKFLIKDSKFHCHPKEKKICSVYIEDEHSLAEKSDTTKEVDPLFSNYPNIEMIDSSESAVMYKIMEQDYSDITEEVIPENIEILPFGKEEIELIRNRLNSFRLNNLPEVNPIEEMYKGFQILEAQTISEAEFSACSDAIETENSDEKNDTNLEIDILSNAIHQELGEGFPFHSQSQNLDNAVCVEIPDKSLSELSLVDNATSNCENLPNSVGSTSSSTLGVNNSEHPDIQEIIKQIMESTSSILNSKKKNTETSEAEKNIDFSNLQLPVGSLRNIPNLNTFESIMLEKSVVQQFIGQVLSNDDIKLLSQFRTEHTNVQLCNENNNINSNSSSIGQEVPVNREVLVSIREVPTSNNSMTKSFNEKPFGEANVINTPFQNPSLISEADLENCETQLSSVESIPEFANSPSQTQLPGVVSTLKSVDLPAVDQLSSSFSMNDSETLISSQSQCDDLLVNEYLTHLLNKSLGVETLEADLSYSVFEKDMDTI